MKKIILLICILIGVSSCSVIRGFADISNRNARGYKTEYKQEQLALEHHKLTYKFPKTKDSRNNEEYETVWNGMKLIIPKNTTIDKEGKLVYKGYQLRAGFTQTANREELCRNNVNDSKQWYKKYDGSYRILEFYEFKYYKGHPNFNLDLAEDIAALNDFIEC